MTKKLKRQPQQRKPDRKNNKTPKGKINTHKGNAKRRGIEFLFTFAQWWKVWEASGKWKKRGNRKGKFCMCRRGDTGPYSAGNVYIGAWTLNTAERNRVVAAKNRDPYDMGATRTISNVEEAPF